jgi:hypothetical protein
LKRVIGFPDELKWLEPISFFPIVEEQVFDPIVKNRVLPEKASVIELSIYGAKTKGSHVFIK